MAVLTLFPNANGVQNLMTTELNSMGQSSLVVSSIGGTSGVFTNLATGGTTGFGGYPGARIELLLAAPASAFSQGVARLWFLRNVSGTDYEDGSTSVFPAREANVLFYIKGSASAQRLYGVNGTGKNRGSERIDMPVGNFKCLFLTPALGLSLASSGNTIRILTDTDDTT